MTETRALVRSTLANVGWALLGSVALVLALIGGPVLVLLADPVGAYRGLVQMGRTVVNTAVGK